MVTWTDFGERSPRQEITSFDHSIVPFNERLAAIGVQILPSPLDDTSFSHMAFVPYNKALTRAMLENEGISEVLTAGEEEELYGIAEKNQDGYHKIKAIWARLDHTGGLPLTAVFKKVAEKCQKVRDKYTHMAEVYERRAKKPGNLRLRYEAGAREYREKATNAEEDLKFAVVRIRSRVLRLQAQAVNELNEARALLGDADVHGTKLLSQDIVIAKQLEQRGLLEWDVGGA